MKSSGELPVVEASSFSLGQLQHWMQAMLIPQALPENEEAAIPSIAVAEVVNPSKRLSAEQHLAIYRYSYIARLRSCMQSQFSALAYALGSELFELFADQYLDACPSESYSLNTLGKRFPGFLAETRPDAEEEVKETWPDFMIELAEFEYALSVIFDEQAMERETVIADEVPDEQLQLATVLHLFHHQYPICNYYLEFSQGKEPGLPFPEESYCAVTRHHYKLGLFTIRGAQYHFLKNMQESHSVATARESLLATFGFKRDDFERLWPDWRKSFLEAGILVAS